MQYVVHGTPETRKLVKNGIGGMCKENAEIEDNCKNVRKGCNETKISTVASVSIQISE